MDDLGNFSRAQRPKTLPIVLTKPQTISLLENLDGIYYLIAALLYGTGMRLMECVRLRVKDIDFGYQHIMVRQAKGNKDRVVPYFLLWTLGKWPWIFYLMKMTTR